MTLLHEISNRIKARRKALKLSQEQLAKKCGLHRQFIGNIERDYANFTIDSLEKLAKGLNCTMSELLGESLKEEFEIFYKQIALITKTLENAEQNLVNTSINVKKEFDSFRKSIDNSKKDLQKTKKDLQKITKK